MQQRAFAFPRAGGRRDAPIQASASVSAALDVIHLAAFRTDGLMGIGKRFPLI